MGELYKTVIGLCEQRGITGYRLCKDIGISPNTITEMRKGRRSGVSAGTLAKIAAYFGVTVESLLGAEKAAVDSNDGLSERERALIDRFRAANPTVQDFVLHSLETDTPLQNGEGNGEEGK